MFGKESSGLGNILIKDNVTLDLEAADDNGIGIGVYGAGAGNITIKDNAVLEAYGGTAAINKAPVMPDNASVSVGESAETAEAWDGTSDITQYKYVRINASGEEPQETEPAATESAAPATSAPSETPAASTPSAAPATTAPAETEEPPALRRRALYGRMTMRDGLHMTGSLKILRRCVLQTAETTATSTE